MSAAEQTRIDVATVVLAIQAAWSAYDLVVETDNREAVNQDTQENPFLRVKVVPISAMQLDMADRPRVKQYGQIKLEIVAKEGSGQSASNILLDFVRPYFEMKSFTLLNCHEVEEQTPSTSRGWRTTPAVINYWYVRTT